MNSKFDVITSLQYRNKSLNVQLQTFLSGEKYISMQQEYNSMALGYEKRIKQLKSELAAAHSETVTVRKNWIEIFEDIEAEHRREIVAKEREINLLKERTIRIEQQRDEALNKLSEKRRELYETLTQLDDKNGEIKKLKAQINRDYENSSLPSSAKPNHKKIRNSRIKSERLPGGQPGHKGHERRKQESGTIPVFIAAPEEITSNPDWYPTGKTIEKQVVDLKLVVAVTDYRALEYRNRVTGSRYHAPFPHGVNNEMNYGAGAKAMAFILNNYCNVSIEKTQEFIFAATEGAVKLSAGMINGLGKVFSNKTKKERAELFSSLLGSPVLYTDATGTRINGKSGSVFVCTNGNEILYFLREHKGHDGVKGTPVENYVNTLVHDHDMTFYNYGDSHQECIAHILRYLLDSQQNEPHLTWNKEMHSFLQNMIHEVKMDRNVSEEKCLEYEKQYDAILQKAAAEYEYEPPSRYYKEGFNLQKRLYEYRDSYLYFLRHPDVDYTNNISELFCRKYKRKQKQAVTFRSEENAEYFCDALGIIETGRLKNISVHNTVQSVFEM